jgi:predicted PurR-regulated permease PerM
VSSERSTQIALWIVALAVIGAALSWARDWLTLFAVALILWFAIDALSSAIAVRAPALPRWAALTVALVIVLAIVAGIGAMVLRNVGDIAARLGEQGPRLNALAAQAYALLGMPGPPPTLDTMLQRADAGALLRAFGEGLQSIVGGIVFILIYLGFLFSAARRFPEKIDRIFPDQDTRREVGLVLSEIRRSMGSYLGVQTLMSLVITALTLATLVALGMPQAVFWSFLVFFLNYIPTVGSLLAVALVTLAAAVEFESLTQIALVAGGVGLWQFVVGNFIQPRFTGKSLNLSAVVVLLALAFWGSVWGPVGAFLSAPLTTMAMIIRAQNDSTRWIAILLSEDGHPRVLSRPASEQGKLSQP